MKKIKLIALFFAFAGANLTAQSDEKERPFQFTFVTPLGTNGIYSHKTTNNISINLLAGVSRGVNGCEVGTLANVVLKDVNGAQFVGFANVVLGHVHGGQFAGYLNFSGSNVRGVQFAGLGNICHGELHGGQFAAGFNINRGGGKGIQVAGHTNVMAGDFKGTQVACGANIATGDLDGSQISVGFNYARKVKGLQIGFINVADSVEGATIGFLNFVKKGVHQIEVSGDEVFYTNLSYRTGTKAFYNIFSLGMRPGSKDNVWQMGYGVGSSFRLKEKWNGEIGLTAHHVSTGDFYWGTSELYRLYVGVEYKVAKKFTIAAGPTFNLYVSDELIPDYATKQKNMLPYYGLDHSTSNDFNLKGWIGGKIALRFF